MIHRARQNGLLASVALLWLLGLCKLGSRAELSGARAERPGGTVLNSISPCSPGDHILM